MFIDSLIYFAKRWKPQGNFGSSQGTRLRQPGNWISQAWWNKTRRSLRHLRLGTGRFPSKFGTGRFPSRCSLMSCSRNEMSMYCLGNM